MTTPQPTATATVTRGYVPVGRPSETRPGTFRNRTAYLVSQGAQQVNVPKGVPKIVGNSTTIVIAWIVAMAIIAWDEWKVNHILPRPSRLWWTTLVYGILALMGNIGMLLPFATVLAWGYTIVLAWQYFNGSGQFSKGAPEGGGGSGKKK